MSPSSSSRRRTRPNHDSNVALLALAGGLPAVVSLVALLHLGDYSMKLRWTLDVLAVGAWVAFALAVRDRVARPLQTLSNLIAGLREDDYSLRGRTGDLEDPLSQAYHELNLFADRLRSQRLGALEASALLAQVMEEIDVSILAVDDAGALRFLNRAAEALLGQPASALVGRKLSDFGLGELLEGEPARTLAGPVAGRPGPYELSRREFRQEGLPHRLLVLTDLRRALREEERQAWQRLVRVLGHEINNSLAPIQSIAASLADLAAAPEPAADFREDLGRGLQVIARRSESLARFMNSYARLAKLPPPRLGPLQIGPSLERVVSLEKRLSVPVQRGSDATVMADADQLEQVLINLLKNAVEAAHETGGGVRVGWRVGRDVEVYVEDDGPGLANTSNLFVPFFTTKPGGSGIGLVLSRQIVEAHGGHLSVENRADARGCIARLRLPRAP